MDLGDDYIPRHETKYVLKKLVKLPLAVLSHLVLQWAEKYGTENGEALEQLSHRLETLLKKNVKRRILALRILLEYWPSGLCLYQLAQIDCYLIVYKSNQYTWTSSTAWNAKHMKEVFHIDFDQFITNLRKDLQKFYFCNINTFKHPDLPLVICRIQLFDNDKALSDIKNVDHHPVGKNLTSRAPYYVAFSLNSPNIIHSPHEDSFAELILQSVERTLSYREPIILERNETPPVKSLESMQVLFGVSRFAESMGSWSTYGETSFEISPLGCIQNHQSIKGKRILIEEEDLEDNSVSDEDRGESLEIKKLRLDNSMMRFKGSKEGVKRTKLYVLEKSKNQIDSLNKEPLLESKNKLKDISKYASLVPVEKVEFTLQKEWDSQRQVSLKFRFSGKDVFGGLQELCDRRHIVLKKVPGWLTGENGSSSGCIVDGEFIANKKGGLI